MVSIIFNGILEPKGGPSGYLFNLQESLYSNGIKDINIIAIPKIKHKKENLFKKKLQMLKSKLKSKLKNIKKINEARILASYKNLLYKNIDRISNSKILHFHTTKDLYYFSKIYDIKNHTILLMSHSPEAPYIETYNNFLSQGYKEKEASMYAVQQKDMDIFSFKHADFLIFPCEGATKPYEKFFVENNIEISKIRYVLTSSKPLVPKLSSEEYKDKYGLPKDKKIITYVGRKNLIKGFDIFCKIAKECNDNSDLFFISAGIGDIEAIEQDNFLDIGWTDDPASLINASDILIVPNRDTYFDLGIIQGLSLNKTIITTNTGGNSWFDDEDTNIFYADYQDVNTFIKLLINDEIYSSNLKNINLYNNYFTNEIFALNYKKLYEQI